MRKILRMHDGEKRNHEITNFLKRPIIIRQGKWNGTQEKNTILETISLFSNDLNVTYWLNKLQGFFLARSDVKFTLQINAMPMHQGILMFQYIPDSGYTNRIYTSLTSRTGFLRSMLNAVDDTEMSLTVPYVAPTAYINLRKGLTFGALNALVYSKLRTASNAAEVSYTLFAHLENPEFSFPSGANSRLAPLEVIEAQGIWDNDNSSNVIKSRKDAVLIDTTSNMPNVDGAGNTTNFGVSATNTKKCDFGIIRQTDLKAIAQNPNYLDYFEWNILDAAGAQLYSMPVKPTYITTDVFPTYSVQLTHFGFIASLFQYFSGSVKYDFHVSNTKFHKGRLEIYFVPGLDDSGGALDGDSDQCYRTIIDLAGQPKFDYTIPFVSNKRYLTTDEALGTLYFKVLNPLVNNDGTSNTVEINIEMSAGDDISFDQPVPIPFFPVIYLPPDDEPESLCVAQGISDLTSETNDFLGGDRMVDTHDVSGDAPVTDVIALCNRPMLKAVGGTENDFVISPYIIASVLLVPDQSTEIPSDRLVDNIDLFSTIFRFYSGQVNITLAVNDTPNHNMFVALDNKPEEFFYATSPTPLDMARRATSVINTRVASAPTITAPFYNSVPFDTVINGDLKSPPSVCYRVHSTETVSVYRSASKNFDFSFLCGVPALMYFAD